MIGFYLHVGFKEIIFFENSTQVAENCVIQFYELLTRHKFIGPVILDHPSFDTALCTLA